MKRKDQNGRSLYTDGPGSSANDEKTDQSKYNSRDEKDNTVDDEFPGYPHYPPSEDIMNPANQIKRVSVDVENLAPPGSLSNQQAQRLSETEKPDSSINASSAEDDISIVPGTEADVTREDLSILNATEGAYAQTSAASTVTGEDLDVPGADADDPFEDIGEEDEENNYYSLGGDNHENLEEDPS